MLSHNIWLTTSATWPVGNDVTRPSSLQAAGRSMHGAIWNWIALALTILVTFFLTPFIVRQLGNSAYGLWSLVISLTSYMGLLEFGTRGAVTRFVSEGYAKGDHEYSSEVVSTALWIRFWLVLLIIAVSVGISLSINLLFKIPTEFEETAPILIILVGINVAVSMFFGVFGGILVALHRSDLLSGTRIAQTVLRAIGVVWVLRGGFGLLGLAILELVVNLFFEFIRTALSLVKYPQLGIRIRVPSIQSALKIWNYSAWAFLVTLFGMIVSYTDNLVIGAMISLSAVTFFTISASLSHYLRRLVGSLTMTFMPLASRFAATGDNDNLRNLYVQGTRACMLLGLPIIVTLLIRGETFISLWMGPEYGPLSSRVLTILLIAQVFTVANSTTINIALGLSRHRRLAKWFGFEAACNLALSIVLASRYGVLGVAIGTLLPSLFVYIALLPGYICRVIDLPLRSYIWRAWIQPMIATAPYVVACVLIERFYVPSSLGLLFLQVLLILPIYAVTVAAIFRQETRVLFGSGGNRLGKFLLTDTWSAAGR